MFIVTHRKIAREKKCVCGSPMRLIGSNWVCVRQFRTNEESVKMVTKKKSKKVKKCKKCGEVSDWTICDSCWIDIK
jgi:hypothetical protein